MNKLSDIDITLLRGENESDYPQPIATSDMRIVAVCQELLEARLLLREISKHEVTLLQRVRKHNSKYDGGA